MSTTLVLGGARSGKSAFAEQLCADSGLEKIYIATAQIWDEEMRTRVSEHQDRRSDWTTVETAVELNTTLAQWANPSRIVLVDCLTLWLTNLLMDEALDPQAHCDHLVQALPLAGPVVFVSNEVGLGIVPENKLARRFRDLTGRLHQQIAAQADQVVLVAAGLPLTLKGPSRNG